MERQSIKKQVIEHALKSEDYRFVFNLLNNYTGRQKTTSCSLPSSAGLIDLLFLLAQEANGALAQLTQNSAGKEAPQKSAFETRWAEYLSNTSNKPPRGLVKKFVSYLNPSEGYSSKTHVVDIGCGAGNDTLFFSQVEFKVTAVDYNQNAIKAIETTTQSYKNITVKFCDITLEPIPECNIASASYCLPFIQPLLFPKTWHQHIVPRILPGGYFVGHFLGKEDGWANSNNETMTFLTESQVKGLFLPNNSNFEELLFFKEKKKEASLANGGSEFWHIFTVFARKRNIAVEHGNANLVAENSLVSQQIL